MAVKIAVLGGTGMLGTMTLDVLSQENGFAVKALSRDAGFARAIAPEAGHAALDAAATPDELARALGGCAYAVNCIGIIKPYIHDDNFDEVERAITVNSLFPHKLARAARLTGAKVIQIATDCVFSGRKGGYTETDAHDPQDVYGKTKSLGECADPAVFHIRCSIIGPEPRGKKSLLEWFLSRPEGGKLNGFTNHLWNGVTTLHFAKVCAGIIRSGAQWRHLQHLVPGDSVNKYELLKIFAKNYSRRGLEINRSAAATAVDRTLGTGDAEFNRALWSSAGYAEPPTVAAMVREMAERKIGAKP